MGLTGWVANAAVKRVHVMIVEAPGSGLLRMRVEAAVTARGWALSGRSLTSLGPGSWLDLRSLAAVAAGDVEDRHEQP